MSVKTLATSVTGSVLVEISPRRILYEVNYYDQKKGSLVPTTERYSLVLPWSYAIVGRDTSGSYRPQMLLGSSGPWKEEAMVGPLPLVGIMSGGQMCTAGMRIHNELDLLGAVTATLCSGGNLYGGYVQYTLDNKAFLALARRAKIKLPNPSKYIGWPFVPLPNPIDEVYKFWESLDEFPPEIKFSHGLISSWGFEPKNFLSSPQLLVE